MDIFDRLIDSFDSYDEPEYLRGWVTKMEDYGVDRDLEMLSDERNFENVLNKFGSGIVSDSLNCASFHPNGPRDISWGRYSEWPEYDKTIRKVQKFFEKNTNNIFLKNLIMPKDVCDIHTDIYFQWDDDECNPGMIPPIFYRYGFSLDTIGDLYKNDNPKVVLEIGAGYGGFPYLFSNKFDGVKYIILDIEPATSIAGCFLDKLGKNIILPNEFTTLEDFINSNSDFLFIRPSQIESLPDESIDLVLSIDSIPQASISAIRHYINHINRITKKYFYSLSFGHLDKNNLNCPESMIDTLKNQIIGKKLLEKEFKLLSENFERVDKESSSLNFISDREYFLLVNLAMTEGYCESVFTRNK